MPLVLVHGAGGSHRSWDPLREHLPEAIAVDQPGRESAPRDALASVSDIAAWLRASITLDRYALAGHSMGGAVALELALAGDPRLAALILVSTGARLRVHPDILAEMERAAREQEPSALSQSADPRVPPATALADWRNANAFDRIGDPRVASLAIPTLVVSGSDDRLTPPKYAQWLVSNIPGATLATLHGAGHELHVTHARELAQAIGDFLAAQARP